MAVSRPEKMEIKILYFFRLTNIKFLAYLSQWLVCDFSMCVVERQARKRTGRGGGVRTGIVPNEREHLPGPSRPIGPLKGNLN